MKNDRYNAACSWALAHEPDCEFHQLDIIVQKLKDKDYAHTISDPDLNPLHTDSSWKLK